MRSFLAEKSGACLKRERTKRGECQRRKFLREFLQRERDESAKACVDRDPRDFTVHRSSYKAPKHSPASFSGLTSRRVPARGKRKKEQLRSRREMARLKCSERAQWRAALRENDFISVGMIIAPLQLQSSVNCVLSEGLHYS